MPLVVVNREEERKRLLEETAAIRARLDREAKEEALHLLADAGDRLLSEREAALGVE